MANSLRTLQTWMKISTLLYAVGGTAFAVAPHFVFALMNAGGAVLGLRETPLQTERFWLCLAVSMMMMLVVCCTLVAQDPKRHLALCIPVFISKFTSTLMGLMCFVMDAPLGSYLTIGWTDLPLGIITLWLWRRAQADA